MVVVSVYDMAAGAYGRPAYVASRGAAMRSFQDEVNRVSPENVMNVHPGDFQLYLLGSFDELTGRFTLLDLPERICSGSDVKTTV